MSFVIACIAIHTMCSASDLSLSSHRRLGGCHVGCFEMPGEGDEPPKKGKPTPPPPEANSVPRIRIPGKPTPPQRPAFAEELAVHVALPAGVLDLILSFAFYVEEAERKHIQPLYKERYTLWGPDPATRVTIEWTQEEEEDIEYTDDSDGFRRRSNITIYRKAILGGVRKFKPIHGSCWISQHYDGGFNHWYVNTAPREGNYLFRIAKTDCIELNASPSPTTPSNSTWWSSV